MKIKLTTSMAGKGFAHNAGDTIDRPDAEAARLIEAGFAVPVVADAAELETATDPAAEPVETREQPAGEPDEQPEAEQPKPKRQRRRRKE